MNQVRLFSLGSAPYRGIIAFDYAAAGRLTSESPAVTFGQTTTYTVQSQYDAANRRTGITYPDGSVVARQYTARDQLAQIDYNSAMVATFGYDNGSRRTSRTLGDTPGTQTAWVYGRQDNLPTAINSAIPGASFSYSYDANKNKLTEGISAPMANFGFSSTAYDPADRLTAWNRTDGNLDQAWNLSLVGNWATFTQNQVQQTRTHTAVHEIAAVDAAPLAHDAAGNLTRTAGDLFDRYTWDFDNRLLAADVDQDGTPECAYRYDALGRRVSKTVPDGEGGSVTTVFVGTIQSLPYSPHSMQVVAEYASGAAPASPARKFVYAKYIDEPVMMLATSGATTTPYCYHQNSLYSVAALTDASGTVVERYAYSAYGKPLFLEANANLLAPQASTIGNPYLFTARRLDEETGFYYYRARMYDTQLGRFVSRDPIGYDGEDFNLYRYCRSVPTTRTDASGRQEIVIAGVQCNLKGHSPTAPRIGPVHSLVRECLWSHEMVHYRHFEDKSHAEGSCCQKCRVAYHEAEGNQALQAGIMDEWNQWIEDNKSQIECPAYEASVQCAGGKLAEHNCYCYNYTLYDFVDQPKYAFTGLYRWYTGCRDLDEHLKNSESQAEKRCEQASKVHGKHTPCPDICM